jgi:hypothetical protein
VGDFSRVNVTPELATFAADHVGQTLGERGLKVVSQRDVQAMLGLERQKQLLGCTDDSTSCSAELAQALGVDLLLVGTFARLGQTLQVNLRVLSARDGSVRARFSGTADEEAQLPKLLTRAGEALADALLPAPPGSAPRPPPTASWVLLGGGVAVAAAGGVCLFLQEQDHASLIAPASQGVIAAAAAEGARDRGKALQTAGPILLGVGAAALAAGLVVWVAAPRAAPVVSATLTPGGATVVVSGEF